MINGHVKWFNNAKGYGFILQEGCDEDYFAHYSSIAMDGYKTLKAGQPVSFDILAGPKGSHAINIQVIETAQKETTQVDAKIAPQLKTQDDATIEQHDNHQNEAKPETATE